MPQYRITVYESVSTRNAYIVKADDEDGAVEAAAAGDTLRETAIGTGEVTNREVDHSSVELVPPEDEIAVDEEIPGDTADHSDTTGDDHDEEQC
jgi:hypothetical protein